MRTRTDPTLKWLLNERAALAGAQQSTLEAIPRLQRRVHRAQALLEKARHSLAVAEKAIELNSAKLQALDITLAQFNSQVAPILDALADIAAADTPPLDTLLADVKNPAREKWDWALPDALLRKAYASQSVPGFG